MTGHALLCWFARRGYRVTLEAGDRSKIRIRNLCGPTHPDALDLARYAKPMLLAYLQEHPPIPWHVTPTGRLIFGNGNEYIRTPTGGWKLVVCPHCPEATR